MNKVVFGQLCGFDRIDYQAPADGGVVASIALGDYDGDGNLDLAWGATDAVWVYRGDGVGGFELPFAVPFAGSRQWVLWHDLNDDGFDDLICSLQNEVAISLSNGAGQFQLLSGVPIVGANQVVVADLNADGFQDLAAVITSADRLVIALGNGSGGFGPVNEISVVLTPYGLAVADLNQDGNLDLALAGFGANAVQLLWGNGNGEFGSSQFVHVGFGPFGVRIADCNNDGLMDLVTANDSSDDCSVAISTGGGGFLDAVGYQVGNVPRGLGLADIDRDGNVDVIAGIVVNETVSILRGIGDGTFALKEEYIVADGVVSVAIGDLDSDGFLDIVAKTGTKFSVLLNRCVLRLPQFVRQPEGTLLSSGPQLVTISVEVQSVDPVEYQWLRDGVPLEDGSSVSGTNSADLSLIATVDKTGLYTCEVTNGVGTVESASAIVAFRPVECSADYFADGALNFFDIAVFLTDFNAGCP